MLMRANMPGLARPVRIDARSSRATDDRLLHLLLGIEEGFVDHFVAAAVMARSCTARGVHRQVVTSVPIFSPATARAILPSVSRLNTRIGMPLSMHRLNAVASAT